MFHVKIAFLNENGDIFNVSLKGGFLVVHTVLVSDVFTSDGWVKSLSRKIHAGKHFSEFHGITFHFSSK